MIESRYLDYDSCRRDISARIADRTPGRIQLLCGPRQVGKSTLLRELRNALGDRAIYAAADAYHGMQPGFWERYWASTSDLSASRPPRVLLIDELHYIHDWAARIKAEWDRLRRREASVHVVASASVSLNPGGGLQEGQSTRFEKITLSHPSAAYVAAQLGLSAEKAAHHIVRFGSYPGTFPLLADREQLLGYVRESIIYPTISRDILALGVVRKPSMLRQVFMAAATAPARVVPLQAIQRQLQDRVAIETVAQYLRLLRHAYLLADVDLFSHRIARERRAPPKLLVLNNALCAAVDPRGTPDPSTEPDRFHDWVENACLAFAYNSGQRVQYWRREQLSVAGVTDGSWGRWAIDVRTRLFTASDVRGLVEFTSRNPSFAPLILCSAAMLPVAARIGITAQRWTDFLIHGPPRA